jgi:hypothetical protein
LEERKISFEFDVSRTAEVTNSRYTDYGTIEILFFWRIVFLHKFPRETKIETLTPKTSIVYGADGFYRIFGARKHKFKFVQIVSIIFFSR